MHLLVTLKIHHLQHVINLRVDVVNLVVKALLKKSSHSQINLLARDYLARVGYGEAGKDVDPTRLGFELALNKGKDRALACPVLTHDGNLGSTANIKISLI